MPERAAPAIRNPRRHACPAYPPSFELFATIGPMARSVADLALLLEAIAGLPAGDRRQFGHDTVRVEGPHRFCNPVEKVSEARRFRIEERQVHLTCYEIFGPQKTIAQTFGVRNQFETDVFTVTSHQLLCVPSAKLGFTPSASDDRRRHLTGRGDACSPCPRPSRLTHSRTLHQCAGSLLA